MTTSENFQQKNTSLLLNNETINDSLPKKREFNLEHDSSENAENYQIKQNELSNWYYIKSKPKAMSIYDETKAKNLSSRHNFSTTSLQKFRSIEDLHKRQLNTSVIQNDILKYNSREQLFKESATRPSFNPDVDFNSEKDYTQSLRIAATKLKNQQLSVSVHVVFSCMFIMLYPSKSYVFIFICVCECKKLFEMNLQGDAGTHVFSRKIYSQSKLDFET
jgi:hypothetical protein